MRDVYVILKGRLGNQLFIYSFVMELLGSLENSNIIIDDSEIELMKWENSIPQYGLPENVTFVHKRSLFFSRKLILQSILLRIVYRILNKKNYKERYDLEKKYCKLLTRLGLYTCENGFLGFPKLKPRKSLIVSGYFQSEKYFETKASELRKLFKNLTLKESSYSFLLNKNSVCLSIKIEDNLKNPLWGVCTVQYWKEAIEYILQTVVNPVFFICSDNVELVAKTFTFLNDYEVHYQDKNLKPTENMLVMSMCKFFIIGNTSYGWWAQYLADDKKMTIAPSRWCNDEKLPIAIYQNDWHLINV